MNIWKKALCLCVIIMAHGCLPLPCKAQAASAPKIPVVVQDVQGKSVITNSSLRFNGQPIIKKQYQKNIFIGDASSLVLQGDLEDYDITYKSSNPSILNVSQVSPYTCDYYGTAAGTAYIIIRIKSTSGLFFMNKATTIKAKVVVSPWAVSVKFQRSRYRISVGKTKKIHTTIRPSISKEKPVYESQNTQIATVNSKGFVKARQEGTTYIIASLHNGIQAKCKIVVKKNKQNKTDYKGIPFDNDN